MSDSSITLNAGSGGAALDSELLSGSTHRERMQVAGALLAEVARVLNTAPVGSEYGLGVRQVPRKNVTGTYFFAVGTGSIQTSAHNGTTGAFFWLQNPISSGKVARLRWAEVNFNSGVGETDQTGNPRLMHQRFTFTGTATGATITPNKRASGDATNTCTVRTANTGMTVSLVTGQIWAPMAPALRLTTSGISFGVGPAQVFLLPEELCPEIAGGEGIVVYQADAAAASDPRRFSYCYAFDEY